MKRDHFCFVLFLILLFIAPELPVGAVISSGAALSSLPLGFVGLLFWLIVSPRSILKFSTRPLAALLLVSFAIYAWFVSGFSGKTISILYASQYLFYSLFGFLVLRSYLLRATVLGELNEVFAIIIIIGVIYSIGTIASVFTGPIYPHQTHWTGRLVEGNRIPRGVGFADNPNTAGGVLGFYLAASLFLYPLRWRYQWLVVAVTGLGLFATLSRSAILSFVLAYGALLSLWSLRTLVARRSSWQLSRSAVSWAFLVVGGLTSAVMMFLMFGGFQTDLTNNILSWFGLGMSGSAELIRDDIRARLELWNRGIHDWMTRGELSALFGVGLRNSMAISEYGTWATSHNFYISMLSEEGVIGLLVFISVLLGSIGKACRRLLTRPGLKVYPFAFLAILALSFHNMTETFLYSPAYVTLLLYSILLMDAQDQALNSYRVGLGTGRSIG